MQASDIKVGDHVSVKMGYKWDDRSVRRFNGTVEEKHRTKHGYSQQYSYYYSLTVDDEFFVGNFVQGNETPTFEIPYGCTLLGHKLLSSGNSGINSSHIVAKLDEEGNPLKTRAQQRATKQKVRKELANLDKREKFTQLTNMLNVLGISHKSNGDGTGGYSWIRINENSLTELHKMVEPHYEQSIKDLLGN